MALNDQIPYLFFLLSIERKRNHLAWLKTFPASSTSSCLLVKFIINHCQQSPSHKWKQHIESHFLIGQANIGTYRTKNKRKHWSALSSIIWMIFFRAILSKYTWITTGPWTSALFVLSKPKKSPSDRVCQDKDHKLAKFDQRSSHLAWQLAVSK